MKAKKLIERWGILINSTLFYVKKVKGRQC